MCTKQPWLHTLLQSVLWQLHRWEKERENCRPQREKKLVHAHTRTRGRPASLYLWPNRSVSLLWAQHHLSCETTAPHPSLQPSVFPDWETLIGEEKVVMMVEERPRWRLRWQDWRLSVLMLLFCMLGFAVGRRAPKIPKCPATCSCTKDSAFCVDTKAIPKSFPPGIISLWVLTCWRM